MLCRYGRFPVYETFTVFIHQMINDTENRELSLALLAGGDRAELTRMVDIYSNPVYRIAMKFLNSEQDAEDVTQETFIKVMQAIKSFEGRSRLSTWIYRITVNEALMVLRRRRGVVVSLDAGRDEDSESVDTPVEIEDWCCLPESEFVSAELRKEMDQAIKSLPEKLRIVFILRDLEDLSIKETTEILGLTESAVKTRLLRARLALREQLTHYFQEHKPA